MTLSQYLPEAHPPQTHGKGMSMDNYTVGQWIKDYESTISRRLDLLGNAIAAEIAILEEKFS